MRARPIASASGLNVGVKRFLLFFFGGGVELFERGKGHFCGPCYQLVFGEDIERFRAEVSSVHRVVKFGVHLDEVAAQELRGSLFIGMRFEFFERGSQRFGGVSKGRMEPGSGDF